MWRKRRIAGNPLGACGHGGAATQVIREKAHQRMLEMVSPALTLLEKIIKSADTSDAHAIWAMPEVFDGARRCTEADPRWSWRSSST